MNEITPDLIAQIATRLYNEIPGANRVPKTEAEASDAAAEAAGWPAGVAEIPAADSALPGVPDLPGGTPISPVVAEPTGNGL